MNSIPKTQRPTAVVKKTISLPAKTFKRAEKAAKDQQRNFSNYIATLIAADDGK